MAFAKMGVLCKLQEKHGVDMGQGYKNEKEQPKNWKKKSVLVGGALLPNVLIELFGRRERQTFGSNAPPTGTLFFFFFFSVFFSRYYSFPRI